MKCLVKASEQGKQESGGFGSATFLVYFGVFLNSDEKVFDFLLHLKKGHAILNLVSGTHTKRSQRENKKHAGIAQLVEHLTCNQGVVGSSPIAGTTTYHKFGWLES
jgi:hypothetical protein